MKFNEIQAQTDVERIILIRKRFQMKQYQFSKLLGYTPNHLANVENYKHPVSAKLKRKIEEFLKEQEATTQNTTK
ncbi:helix-turn-helix domain-containing protein [Viridibacillus arvi]|uniref:helix-turn-helix domain-containing protein n=1 Tax=Viridibacillus arvi TaxID=263475 RepID=UPI0034CDEBE5